MTLKVALCLSFLFIVACKTEKGPLTMDAPDKFAVFDVESEKNTVVRAISSNNVLFQARTIKNEPRAELSFWHEALKTHLKDSGYVLLKDETINIKGKDGILVKFNAPVGQTDHRLLVALFVLGDEILVVESAGSLKEFQSLEKNIIAAISTLKNL